MTERLTAKDQIGTTLAGYRIEALLGRGGMSVVYLARDLALGRKVALKLLSAELSDDPRFRERFQMESRLAASIDHANVIPIFEASEAQGQLYIAMRYVEGTDLKQLLADEDALEPERAVRLLAQAAAGLDAAHARGLIHRDVKSSNVLIARQGDEEHVYLADFGLTKTASSATEARDSLKLSGSIDYVSPEQIAGKLSGTVTDIYSLGCVLYEALTGQVPYPREKAAETLLAHLDEAPPRPSELRPKLPRELDAVVAQAMAKDPTRRFGSGRELVEAARAALTELPPGTVTFLFTDIEGSTRLLHELGDRYADVLVDHGRLLREVFGQHGGREVDTQGDSFFVAFGDASDAVRAAAAAQRALAAHPWPGKTEVRVRMGVHTGEPLVAGDHYVGIDVHRAARIAAAAYGGQVLISARTGALLQENGSLANDTLRELGAYPLKDLPEPERLFQLVVDGLPASFPPPRVHEKAPAAAGLPDYSLPPADVPCPYKGLLPFEPEDSDLFFGREELVLALATRLEASAFLAVVGPSGSGKSSLVRAGVVPELERRGESIRPEIIEPGEHPLAKLAGTQDADLIVVDQFEEVFTLCHDEEERLAFVDGLLDTAEHGRRVVVVLRADFYGHCASYGRLAAALEDRQALIGPMTEEELRRAIERPAERAGLVLEPGLAEGILRDVVGEPGALPLLSHSLLETWTRRSDRMLTLVGYLQSGGVRGAIAKTAETVYREGLTPEQKALARNIFLRLTEIGEGTEDTRRRVPVEELTLRPEQAADVEEVLRVLVAARLVTTDEATVEVAHEALIRGWPRLREWLDEDRAGLRTHRRLTEAAHEWARSGRDPEALYRGVRLAQASEWAERNAGAMNPLETEFVRESVKAQERARRRRQRRLRIVVAALAGGLVVVASLALVAFLQKGVADEQSRVAKSREIAATALEQLERDPQLTLLLAIEAYERAPTGQAEAAVRRALVNSHLRRVLPVDSPGETTIDVSPDGKLIATATPLGEVALWDRASGRRIAVLAPAREPSGPEGPGGPPAFLRFSPTGDRLFATGGPSGDGRIWSVPDGRLVTRLKGAGGFFPGGWTPDGRAVLTAADGVARLWDANTGAVRARFPTKGGAREGLTVAVLSPDGRFVAVQDGDATVRLVRASTERTVAVLEGRLLAERGFSRDGRQLVLETPPDGLRIFAVPSGRLLRVIRLFGPADAAFSPDGRRLITPGEGDAARIWDVRSGRLSQELRGHGGEILGVSFSPDGKLALTASADSTARLWDAATGRALAVFAGHAGVVGFARFTPNGRSVVTASDDVRVWEVAGGAAAILRGHDGPVISARFSPDGRSLISANQGDGIVRVWNVATRRQRSVLRPPRSPGTELFTFAEFSADGRLAVTSGVRSGPDPLREQEPARLWELETGKVRVEFTTPPSEREKVGFGCPAPDAALSPDGARLATVAECDGMLRVWDAAKGALLKTVKLGQSGNGVAWTPDGSKIVAVVEARVHVVDATSFRKIRAFGEGGGGHLPAATPEIDRRGALVALGSDDRTARVWELATGRLVAELPHAGPVSGVAFSPNGQFLVAASTDAPTIWDLEAQRPLVQLFGHSGGVGPVDFSPDGSSILSGGEVDRSVRIWRCEVCAPIDEVLRLARSRVLSELTPAERARFLGEGER